MPIQKYNGLTPILKNSVDFTRISIEEEKQKFVIKKNSQIVNK